MIDQASLPPVNDLDETMLRVARNLAQGIYPLEQVLEFCQVDPRDFNTWKDHPRFIQYLSAESEQWSNATNAHERTKVKAGIILEGFMLDAGAELADRKLPLNHRVELGKLLAKIAGMGEPKLMAGAGGGGGFTLQINIAPGQPPVQIKPDIGKVINHDEYQDDN